MKLPLKTKTSCETLEFKMHCLVCLRIADDTHKRVNALLSHQGPPGTMQLGHLWGISSPERVWHPSTWLDIQSPTGRESFWAQEKCHLGTPWYPQGPLQKAEVVNYAEEDSQKWLSLPWVCAPLLIPMPCWGLASLVYMYVPLVQKSAHFICT